MTNLMRCLFCGKLQDEPPGVKECQRCGGELAPEITPIPTPGGSYLGTQLELDQVQAPAGRNLDRYLMVTLTTPAALPPEHMGDQESGRAPVHFTPVVDVSGSMQGEKLAQVKGALRQALRHLGEGDTISLVTFSSEIKPLLRPVTFDGAVEAQIGEILGTIQASGMTALDAGLKLGIELASSTRCDTNLVMLLSDGQANVGETDLEKVGQRAWAARQAGMVISTLGVGMDYNEALMAEIANQGGGRFYHIQHANQIPAYLTGELGDAASVAARGLTIILTLPPGAILTSLLSAYPVEQTGTTAKVLVGDIPLDLELEIPLRLTLSAQAPGARLSTTGTVHYQSPAGRTLSGDLNRVTVRFVAPGQFEMRQGLAAPVVEKVIQHRQAAYVMDYARGLQKDRANAERLAEQEANALREYLSLVDEDRSNQLFHELRRDRQSMSIDPASSKRHVSSAMAFARKTRKHDQD